MSKDSVILYSIISNPEENYKIMLKYWRSWKKWLKKRKEESNIFYKS
jgi:hypothetical protein